MALSFSKTRSGVMGDLRYWAGTVTFDSAYPTGGEAVAKSDFGFSTKIVHLGINQTDEAGVDAEWDAASGKIKLFDEDNTSGIAAEFANGGDASGVVLDVFALGF